MNFRFMKESDLNEVSILYELCFPEACMKKERKVTYRDGILIAILDNKIVGMLTIDYLNDNFLDEKCAYINNVCVHPEYQGRGIGYDLGMREDM